MKKYLLVFCGFLIIISFLLYWANRSQAKPYQNTNKVLNGFVLSLRDNDLVKTKSYWTAINPLDLNSAGTEGQTAFNIISSIRLEQKFAAQSEYKITEKQIEGNLAYIYLQRYYPPQKATHKILVRMICNDGEWKIAQWDCEAQNSPQPPAKAKTKKSKR
jgi:hypothetical protein